MKYPLSLLAMTLTLAGCTDPQEATSSNFSKSIQNFYNGLQPAICLPLPQNKTPFVLVNSSFDKRQADILVKLGLLSSKPTQVEVNQLFGSAIKEGMEYEMTKDGEKYFVEDTHTNKFCTGRYSVKNIENFTSPNPHNGITVSYVNFTYTIEELAKWAENPAILEFDGKLKQLLEPPERKGKATLLLTNKGWVHEQLFRQ